MSTELARDVAYGQLGMLAAQETFAAKHSWFQVRRLPGKSQSPMLEVPEMVAAEIEHFVVS